MGEWISVKDRLPKESGEYLTLTTNGNHMILSYSAKHKLFNSYDGCGDYELEYAIKCSHWMPLPELPEGA